MFPLAISNCLRIASAAGESGASQLVNTDYNALVLFLITLLNLPPSDAFPITSFPLPISPTVSGLLSLLLGLKNGETFFSLSHGRKVDLTLLEKTNVIVCHSPLTLPTLLTLFSI